MRQRITQLFTEFTRSEKNGGLVLVVCTVFSLILSNLATGEGYVHFWHQHLQISFLNFKMSYTIEQWINDGLMSVFFLLVGLEIERELYEGELHPIKNAITPIVAAIGGMLVPALIFIILNYNSSTIKGFGIPMATDIAFSLVVLSLASNKVPTSIKVLLTSLAIIDDLGAILVIALFYGKSVQWYYLMSAIGIFIVLLLMNRLRVYRITPYLILGVIMWYCMLMSGIHATLSGVLLAFALPFGYKDGKNPSLKLQELLHVPVAFIVLPLFTLANTCIPIHLEYLNKLFDVHSIGIAAGLVVGKPLGIFLSIYLIYKLRIVTLPENISWHKIWAMGMSAGIGFTMSIFITHLAFNDEVLIQSSKMMVLLSSFVSGLLAYLMFLRSRE